MAFSEDFVDEVRHRADIIEVISDYVKLKRQGKNFVGLCPFHQEKTPSFSVNREKNLYYCFGCGAGGDAFSFLMDIDNLSFIESAKALAERFGIPVPEKRDKGYKKRQKLRDKLFEIHEWAARYYEYLLMEHDLGESSLKYFKDRGLTEETIKKFGLGYAPDAWTALFNFLKEKDYSEKELEKSGLVLRSKKGTGFYDRFRDRAMFTIFNLRGQPIGFGGRVMQPDQQPKYLNSPETPIFIKNKNLYGLNFAKKLIRQTGNAVVVEGYTDVITAHQFGIENVIASLGTSLTKNQAQLLARYADQVYIAYDADTAGQKATLRGLDILKDEGLVVKVVQLPENSDPDELIRNRGVEAFEQVLANSISLIDFKLNQTLKEQDLSNPDGKIKAVEELLPVLLNIDNAIEKDYLINEIVKRMNISEDALREELEEFKKKKSKIKDRKRKNWHTNRVSNKNQERKQKLTSQQLKVTKFEAKFLNALLRKPEMLARVFEEITPQAFQNKLYQTIAEELYNFYQEHRESRNFVKLDINQFRESFDDERLGKRIVKLFFDFNEFVVTEEFVEEGLTKLKEYQKDMKLGTIKNKIRRIKEEGSLAQLNQVLISYHSLLHSGIGKGGY